MACCLQASLRRPRTFIWRIAAFDLAMGKVLHRLVFLDFGELRDNGISHPDMGRIEKLLRTGNGARDVK